MNFTKRALETLPAPDKRAVLHFDSAVRGLGLKIEPTGRRTFFWSRRVHGRLYWLTIGEYQAVTLDTARAVAGARNTQVAEWKRKHYSGPAPWVPPPAPPTATVREIITAYTERHIKAHAKRPERAAEAVEWMAGRYLGDFGGRQMETITRADVVALHEKVGKENGRYAANRVLQMLSAATNWAIDADFWHGTNPAAGVKKFAETKRKRFLHKHEMVAFGKALDSPGVSADLRDFVGLALFTGARKSDVLGMRWQHIDEERKVWRVPEESKGGEYDAILLPEALGILRERRERMERVAKKSGLPVSEFVFPSHSAAGHVRDLKSGWAVLIKTSGLTDVRVHDLRRSLASWQAIGGASLPIIGASLGHTSLDATAIYARLSNEPIRASMAAAVRAMTAAMGEARLLPAAKKQKQRLLPAPKKAARRD